MSRDYRQPESRESPGFLTNKIYSYHEELKTEPKPFKNPLWHVAQWASRSLPHHTFPAFQNLNGRKFYPETQYKVIMLYKSYNETPVVEKFPLLSLIFQKSALFEKQGSVDNFENFIRKNKNFSNIIFFSLHIISNHI